MCDCASWIHDPLEDAPPAVDRSSHLGQRPLNTIATTEREDPATLGNVINDKAAGSVEGIGLETAADPRSAGEFLSGETGLQPLCL